MLSSMLNIMKQEHSRCYRNMMRIVNGDPTIDEDYYDEMQDGIDHYTCEIAKCECFIENERKYVEFLKNRAAKTIQRAWKQHIVREILSKHPDLPDLPDLCIQLIANKV